MTSRDEFLNDHAKARKATLDALYRAIEAEMEKLKGRATTFSVPIPDKATSDIVDEVIAYYQGPERGWTVTRSTQHTDRYLNFA